MRSFLVLVVFVCLGMTLLSHLASASSTFRLKGYLRDDKEDWAYVNVRKDAYMFWWLYYAREKSASAPIVIWLQGGPGGSSTGFGNFMEIGPQDVNLNPRSVTWVETANVLFIDNPVGTGYSYVTSDDAYTTTNEQIADDLVTLIIAFYKRHPEFQTANPLYIFSESYGGKMAAGFGQALTKAIQAGRLTCNFKGVAMGDSWISPVDSVNSWGPYLYSISLLDNKGLGIVNKAAKAVEDAFNQGKYAEATEQWDECEGVVVDQTFGVDFYNILDNYGESLQRRKDHQWLTPIERLYTEHVLRFQQGDLNALMNGPIKKKLGIPKNVTWGGQSQNVFSHLNVDFMKPVYNVVDSLLTSNLTVVTYNGQLDLIVDTVGTEVWIQKLHWHDLPSFNSTSWKAVYVEPGKPAAFVKQYKNMASYWIMKAGHMVPSDAPKTAYKMMELITLLIKE